MIRLAIPDDLDALCSLGQRFTEQSDLPLTWAPVTARQTIWEMLHNKELIILVDDENGVLSGAIMGSLEHDFFIQTCAYIQKFFVEKEFRGLGVSQELLAAFERETKDRGASIVFAAATAGMGQRIEKLYVRLFEKHGYSVLGRVLVKEI